MHRLRAAAKISPALLFGAIRRLAALPPCAWYQFTVDRKGEHPVSHLSGYKGWVHADGYAGFNGVFGADKAEEMACMAHVRRKFVDVFTAQGSTIAEEATSTPATAKPCFHVG